jgi:hypothetical protein
MHAVDADEQHMAILEVAMVVVWISVQTRR